MWNIKKKLFPKIKPQVPTGKKNIMGKLITNPIELRNVYMEEYLGRLRNRPMHPEMIEIQKLEEDLFKIRNELAKQTISEEFKMEELDSVLSALKANKARDPGGLVNELLSSAGAQLRKSLLEMFNTIKSKQVCPEFLNSADCVTIYKGKGKKMT